VGDILNDSSLMYSLLLTCTHTHTHTHTHTLTAHASSGTDPQSCTVVRQWCVIEREREGWGGSGEREREKEREREQAFTLPLSPLVESSRVEKLHEACEGAMLEIGQL